MSWRLLHFVLRRFRKLQFTYLYYLSIMEPLFFDLRTWAFTQMTLDTGVKTTVNFTYFIYNTKSSTTMFHTNSQQYYAKAYSEFHISRCNGIKDSGCSKSCQHPACIHPRALIGTNKPTWSNENAYSLLFSYL